MYNPAVEGHDFASTATNQFNKIEHDLNNICNISIN